MPEMEDEDGDHVTASRISKGSHVIDSNGYITFTNSEKFPDVKVHIVKRWCIDAELGRAQMSKTIVCARCGQTSASPHKSLWALRAWMLWRATCGGWHVRKSARLRWWTLERDRLRQDIQVSGGVGDAFTEMHISECAPTVL